jgi:hypothetical protein
MTEQDIEGFKKAEDDMFTFMKARREAEEAGQNFTCTLCGGDAWWGRATINNHLHTRCNCCGFSIMA